MSNQPYIGPSSTVPLPSNFTLTQFIQTVFVGISELPGPMVRPAWQVEPPKQPDLPVDWMAIGIANLSPDTYGYVGVTAGGSTISQRQEILEIQCSIYGPNALDTYGLIRDGFQIPQNLQALTSANMGYKEMNPGRRVPELVNERWINKIVTSVFIARQIQRTYPILTLVSASGIIYVPDISADYLLDWETPPA